MFVSPPNSYAEILMPSVMVLGGEACGSWLGHEGGAHTNGISALIKEIPQSSLAPSVMWEHGKKSATWPEEDPHQTVLPPWPGASSIQNCEK